MADDAAPRVRYGEAFWRAHHEAWKRVTWISGNIATRRISR